MGFPILKMIILGCFGVPLFLETPQFSGARVLEEVRHQYLLVSVKALENWTFWSQHGEVWKMMILLFSCWWFCGSMWIFRGVHHFFNFWVVSIEPGFEIVEDLVYHHTNGGSKKTNWEVLTCLEKYSPACKGYLEPKRSNCKWLFQLDDSKSLQ